MARFLHHDLPIGSRKGATAFLAASWFLGLLAGALLFGFAETSNFILMRAAADCRVSIVSLLAVTLLPFLFTAFAVYVSRPWLILPLAFCKACSLAFVGMGVSRAFGSAGWLMRGLVMFSDLSAAPLLIFYWLRLMEGDRGLLPGLSVLIVAAIACICGIDICFLSPILAEL